MGIPIELPEQLPRKAVYVWARDNHLSEPGLDSIFILGCDSEAEAAVVAANLSDRPELQTIRKGDMPPKPRQGARLHYLDQETDPGSIWFTPGSMRHARDGIDEEATDLVRIMLCNAASVQNDYHWIACFDDAERRLENYVRVALATPGSDFDKTFAGDRALLDVVNWGILTNEGFEDATERGFTRDEALRSHADLGDREPLRFSGLTEL